MYRWIYINPILPVSYSALSHALFIMINVNVFILSNICNRMHAALIVRLCCLFLNNIPSFVCVYILHKCIFHIMMMVCLRYMIIADACAHPPFPGLCQRPLLR